MRATLIRIGVALNAVAACIIGLYQVKDALQRRLLDLWPSLAPTAVQQAFEWALIGSVAAIVVSGVSFVAALLAAANQVRVSDHIAGIRALPCGWSDIDAIARLAAEQFGGQASRREDIVRLYTYCPQAFWVLKLNDKLVGYYIVYSLKKAGEEALRGGYFNGASPAPEHIHRSLRAGEAVYVAAIVGVGTKGRAATLGAATAFLAGLRQPRAYARPVTPDGLRIANARGMRCLGTDAAPALRSYCVARR